ncbi:hypothetical protein FCN18_27620 [Prauserella endophytica]|uniref:Alpha-L-rhamnosidase n=1 Tax=Prauserella endophytica TaxID=1592324 RepID=A0ABY2RYA9_9PSEU|nr:hypothetical protein FCN18_27620 [Prauserella endophytica]
MRHRYLRRGTAVLAVVAGLATAGPAVVASTAAPRGHAPGTPVDLTVGDRDRPLNVEGAPLFGWRPVDRDPGEIQTAYQIVVRKDGERVWDSGRVASGSQEYVAYAGPELAPATGYTWTVRTWDRTGKPSPWARQAAFDTGLRDGDWQASWIRRTTAEADDYTLARKEFTLGRSPVVRARVYIAASHQYALHVNGTVVDRGGAFACPDAGYYRAVDVTRQLRAGGKAVVGVQYHWYGRGQGRPAGEPGMLLRLEVDHADGTTRTVVSDGSWQVTRGPWLPAPKRNGDGGDYVEEFDATAEPLGWDRPGFDASAWQSPQVLGTHPAGVFTSLQAQETDLEFETVEPVSVTRLESGTLVADFGKVIPAAPIVRFRDGEQGRHVAMHAGYVLNPDGTVSRDSDDNQNTNLAYGHTQRDGDQTFRSFTYMGFRYLEVEDPSAEISAVVQHTAVDDDRRAWLRSSDPGVDAAFDLMRRSALYGSQEQFLDTPTREKGAVPRRHGRHLAGHDVRVRRAHAHAAGDPPVHRVAGAVLARRPAQRRLPERRRQARHPRLHRDVPRLDLGLLRANRRQADPGRGVPRDAGRGRLRAPVHRPGDRPGHAARGRFGRVPLRHHRLARDHALRPRHEHRGENRDQRARRRRPQRDGSRGRGARRAR